MAKKRSDLPIIFAFENFLFSATNVITLLNLPSPREVISPIINSLSFKSKTTK
jgi:hypothetical protein